MKRGGQKAKGNAHERSVAETFTKAYYPTEDGEFRRVPMSGGWDKRMAPGDVIAFKHVDKDTEAMVIDDTFPMVIECKDWRDENIKHFVSGLYSRESQFFDWMEQSWDDSLYVKKIPIVVFKLYRQPNVVMISSKDFYQLANMFGNFVWKFYRLERTRKKGSLPEKGEKDHLVYSVEKDGAVYKHDNLVFVLLKDFLEWIDWEIYKVSGKMGYIRSLVKKERG